MPRVKEGARRGRLVIVDDDNNPAFNRAAADILAIFHRLDLQIDRVAIAMSGILTGVVEETATVLEFPALTIEQMKTDFAGAGGGILIVILQYFAGAGKAGGGDKVVINFTRRQFEYRRLVPATVDINAFQAILRFRKRR